MPRKLIIGVMGGGSASPEDLQDAYQLGSLIAAEGWILLNGGRNAGIMQASAKGAYEKGGLTIGILPDPNPAMMSKYIQVPVVTGMGHARNSINVLSSDVVVACPGGAGTLSEIALALKSAKPVILLNYQRETLFERYHLAGSLHYTSTPEDVIKIIKAHIPNNRYQRS